MLKGKVVPGRFQQQVAPASQWASSWLVVHVCSLCLPVAGKLWFVPGPEHPSLKLNMSLLISQLVSKMLTLLKQII